MSRDGDISHGRGEGRASFSRATRASTLRSAGESVSLGTAIRISQAAEETRSSVEAHHEKHARAWTDRRYGELLKNSPNRPVLTPGWSREDPKAGLRAKANMAVATKKANRLARVAKAESNMLKSGRVRANRRVSWDKGLGE